jgi:HD superfamily phosphohydrolase
MDQYLKRSGGPTGTRQFSIINDNLWGSIRVTELERSLVDSPLLQRLRRIRQLGAAYLVYPSAVHSRFDHSLGALHRASIIMDVLVGASKDRPERSLLADEDQLEKWRSAVRIGALLHDAGHVFLSHAGERTLKDSGLPGFAARVDDLLADAAQALQCEQGIALCELFSYAIITSKSVGELCNKFEPEVGARLPVIAAALIHSRKLVPASERWIGDVLSGPLDVDKQDYVPRDSLMAGVGVQVEPHRCAEVLRVCDFEKATVVNDGDASFEQGERRLVITFSGISVIEDMLLSRMSLSLRVYRHHKVRLAERIAQRAYDYACRESLLETVLDGEPTIAGAMDLTDAAFFAGEVRRRLRRQIDDGERSIAALDAGNMDRTADDARAAKDKATAQRASLRSRRILMRLFELLEERRLPVRAFAYGARFAQAESDVPLGANRAGPEPWAALLIEMLGHESQLKLETEIVELSKVLIKLDDEELDDESAVLLEASVYADLGSVKPVDLSPLFVYSHTNERELVAYDKLFQPSQWLDALRDSKLICYVYAPRSYAHYVHVAAEVVFARRFGAFSRNLRDAYSRSDRKEVERLKDKLFKKYESDIRNNCGPPVPGLWSALTPPSFLSAADKQTYQAFLRNSFQRKEELLRKHPGKVAAFYKQAQEKDCELFAMHIDLIGSSAVVSKVKESGVEEADARLLMLQTLQSYVLTNIASADAAFLPLKTAGDAVLCVCACSPQKLKGLVLPVRELVNGTGWRAAIEDAMKTAGWKLSEIKTPMLRVTVARGDVKWQEELHDLLGTSVTAMFVLESDLKSVGGDGPMIAWLGDWSDEVIGSDARRMPLEHKKVGKIAAAIDAAKP